MLIKGGHEEGDALADALIEEDNMTSWQGQRIDTTSTHGTGCTLASAIAFFLAEGASLADAVARAREFVRVALHEAPGLGQGAGPIGQAARPARRRRRAAAQPGHGDRHELRALGRILPAARPQADRRQPDTGYARFETAGGATFSVQIDPEEKIVATTAIYLECDDLDERVEQLARSGIAVRAWPAQPALDVARGAAARPRRQHHLPLQGRRSAPLPAVADGRLIHRNSAGRPTGDSARVASIGLALDAAALLLQARARLSAAARRRRRGGLRAARRAGGRRRLHPRPRQIPARDRRFSKNLPLEKREAIYAKLVKCSAWGVGIAIVEEIDQINIYWARMLAMTRAVEALGLEPAWVLVDGNATPALAAAVEGDRRRRRQVPLDRRRLDHRQGHARPDHGRLCARLSRLRLGDEPRLSDARASPRARRARA